MKIQKSGTSSDNEWLRMATSDNELQRVAQQVTASDNGWYIKWRRVTTNGNEWKQMTTCGTVSENKWEQVK